MNKEKCIVIVIVTAIILQSIFMVVEPRTKEVIITVGAFIVAITTCAVFILGFINIVRSIFEIKKNKGKVKMWLIIYMLITITIILIGIMTIVNLFIDKNLLLNNDYFEVDKVYDLVNGGDVKNE